MTETPDILEHLKDHAIPGGLSAERPLMQVSRLSFEVFSSCDAVILETSRILQAIRYHSFVQITVQTHSGHLSLVYFIIILLLLILT